MVEGELTFALGASGEEERDDGEEGKVPPQQGTLRFSSSVRLRRFRETTDGRFTGGSFK